jgi:SAM-dependent methyltransferase
MAWRRTMYNVLYRLGRPRWDTGVTPPEVVAAVEGPGHLAPGRALDLGCGTGTNAIYLARHGWDVVGIDFSSLAIARARRKAEGVAGVTLVEGDVTQLARLGVVGPFALVLDIGCFHGLPEAARAGYAREVGRVTRPGSLFMLWAIADGGRRGVPGVPAMAEGEVERHFGREFTVERVERGAWPWPANWYTLQRR